MERDITGEESGVDESGMSLKRLEDWREWNAVFHWYTISHTYTVEESNFCLNWTIAALGWSDDDNEADAEDVEEQVDKFFAELDLDQERKRKRIRSEGVKVCLEVGTISQRTRKKWNGYAFVGLSTP